MLNFRLKYAPKTLNDVVFPSASIKQIITDMVELKTLNHLILYGNYGTGKTTVAELIPDAVLGYTQGVDCIKVDADHESGVDNIRDLKRFVERICIGDKNVKFVIIDEVDGLSINAQKALRGVLDIGNKTSTFFIMTTNHINNIEGGVQSRCRLIKFEDFSPELWLPRAKYICKQEGIQIANDDELLTIISNYGSDTRHLLGEFEEVVRRANAGVV